MSTTTIAVIIFVAAYALIISEKECETAVEICAESVKEILLKKGV